MPRFRNLFLIGPRGVGKTTVARLLASRLAWTFVDADTVLETRFGKTIRRIFEEEGEAPFRAKETLLLEEFCQGQQQVIATGGGIVLSEANRSRLAEAGLSVLLTAPPNTLWQRIEKDPSTSEQRPRLNVGGLAEIEQTWQARHDLYKSCANFILDTDGRFPGQVAEEILEKCWKG
jgi:shikimate kinase